MPSPGPTVSGAPEDTVDKDPAGVAERRRDLRQRWTLMWAGILLIVVVGGIALSLSAQTFPEPCIADPGMAAQFQVTSCGVLRAYAVVEAAVAGVAFVLGLLLLRRADVKPERRLPLAAILFVALLVVVAGIPLALAPPAAPTGIPPELPFPIPAGTTFNASQAPFDAFAEVQVPVDPYAPWAPIFIIGGWNSTTTVCLAVSRAAGLDLGPGGARVCGTSVSFSVGIAAATWVVAFEVPMNMSSPFQTTVRITDSVQIAY